MSNTEKIIKKLLAKPKNFKWSELKKLLTHLGYKETNAGKTSGSRVRFIHEKHAPISLHKPHPSPVLKRYQIKFVINTLKARGQL